MKEEFDEKLYKQCIELAKQGIDIEQLFKDLEPLMKIAKSVIDLAIKNYNYLKGKNISQNE